MFEVRVQSLLWIELWAIAGQVKQLNFLGILKRPSFDRLAELFGAFARDGLLNRLLLSWAQAASAAGLFTPNGGLEPASSACAI